MEKRSEQLMCCIIISQYQQPRRTDESISEKAVFQLNSPELSFVVMTIVLQNFIHVKSQPTPWHNGRLRV